MNGKRELHSAGNRDEFRGFVEIIFAMVLAGSSIVIGKWLLAELSVSVIGFLSLCASFLFMLPLQLMRIAELKKIDRDELKHMFLQALCGIVLFRVFTLIGLRYTTALYAGILTSTTPVVLTLFSRFFLKERLGRKQYLGLILTVAGLVLINIFNNRSAGAAEISFMKKLLGNIFILCAVVSEAFLTIFRKKSTGRISSLTNTTVLVFISILLLSPLFAVQAAVSKIGPISPGSWLGILYYGICATSLAYILWGDGALRIPGSKTGIATAVMPFSALILSVLFLKEKIFLLQLPGCLLILAGMVLFSLKGRKRPERVFTAPFF